MFQYRTIQISQLTAVIMWSRSVVSSRRLKPELFRDQGGSREHSRAHGGALRLGLGATLRVTIYLFNAATWWP